MNEKKTFGTYIKENLSCYFPMLGTRIHAALALLDAYEKAAAASGGGKVCPATAFLSPDALTYEEGVALPAVDFSDGEECRAWGEAPYANFAYGTPHLFDRGHEASRNRDMEDAVSEADAAIILAKLTFYAVFGFHPMCGRQYYRFLPEEDRAAQEKGFFADSPRFIFDIEGNNGADPEKNNRFVNGYPLHENGFVLWNGIHPEQREVFLDAFAGKYGWKEFIAEWRSRFGCDLSQTKAPCGTLIKAVVFPRYGALLLSELGVGFERIRCYGFSSEKGAAAKCADCHERGKAKGEVKIASFKTFPLKVRGGKVEELTLYDGKKICPADFSESEDRAPMFAAVLSPKGDLFGLRYLRNQPITATCLEKSRTYGEKEVLALLAGMEIPVGDQVLFVPAPPTPAVRPETKQEAEPVPEVQAPEVQAPEVQAPEAPHEQGPAKELFRMDSGRVVEFRGDPDLYVKEGGSRHFRSAASQCDVYDVRDVDTGKNCELYVYPNASPAWREKVRARVEIAEASRHVFVLPFDTASPMEKRFAGAFCALYWEPVGIEYISLWAIVQGQRIGPTAERLAALQLAEAIDTLHALGYTFGGELADNGILLGKRGDVRLHCNPIPLREASRKLLTANPKFTAPEVLDGRVPDLHSDDYVLAVALFEIFMHTHPFKGRLATSRSKNGELPFLFDILYRQNAPYAMDAFELNEQWNRLPEEIKQFFRRAFAFEPDPAEEERRRFGRPTAYAWKEALRRWIEGRQ